MSRENRIGFDGSLEPANYNVVTFQDAAKNLEIPYAISPQRVRRTSLDGGTFYEPGSVVVPIAPTANLIEGLLRLRGEENQE